MTRHAFSQAGLPSGQLAGFSTTACSPEQRISLRHMTFGMDSWPAGNLKHCSLLGMLVLWWTLTSHRQLIALHSTTNWRSDPLYYIPSCPHPTTSTLCSSNSSNCCPGDMITRLVLI
ncbi:hypothetical protein J1614_000762 [Plenodomus biglobosus]|nr:hypothetical protein J1614_000762 [Plenodomus biglobosus]